MIAVLILVCLIGLTHWYFFFPGINRLFDYVHFNVEERGYLISPEGEILGEASLTAKGTVKRQISGKTSNREDYDFYLEITGYPAAEQGASLWSIDDVTPKLSTCWSDVTFGHDGDTNFDIKSKIDYTTCLDSKYRNTIGCKIEATRFDVTGSGTIETVGYFVPAENTEDALAQLGLLLETID